MLHALPARSSINANAYSLQETPCHHPVVVLQGVTIAHIRALLTFMYTGETTVPQAELSAFLNTAEVLQIKGLTNFNRERVKAHSCSTFSFRLEVDFIICTVVSIQFPSFTSPSAYLIL
jgi:hypothetical protein